MPLNHSPPNKSKSDLDIPSSANECTPDKLNITTRNKRPRMEFSPQQMTDFEVFKNEMRNMVTSMFTEMLSAQKATLGLLSEDIKVIKSQNDNIQKTNKEI